MANKLKEKKRVVRIELGTVRQSEPARRIAEDRKKGQSTKDDGNGLLQPIEDKPDLRVPIFSDRVRISGVKRGWLSEHFYSDKSRIVFCSSFRRMVQKAQVFSLESNTSVRNRLTHSLEVADVGRTLARNIGKGLEAKRIATAEDTECLQCIVESACLLHDIGNPPFGHFGEEAIKHWFTNQGQRMFDSKWPLLPLGIPRLNDFRLFDGNPQGFRIATRLHWDIDEYSLNLTNSTLLASVKYPNASAIPTNAIFKKKLGIFSSEEELYYRICGKCHLPYGRRYFLAYLMELADDICYCLSDIADSFEKGITGSRDFKEDFRAICKESGVNPKNTFLDKVSKIENFSYDVSIGITRQIVAEATEYFVSNIEKYLAGDARELSKELPTGKLLECFNTYARRFIYTNIEAQSIEIAGSKIVEGLLDHFGRLLKISREDFDHFVTKGELKGRGLDTEWRIFNRLSKRMLRVYKHAVKGARSDDEEWICRARLIVDYISGLTDNSALRFYQNFMGISP